MNLIVQNVVSAIAVLWLLNPSLAQAASDMGPFSRSAVLPNSSSCLLGLSPSKPLNIYPDYLHERRRTAEFYAIERHLLFGEVFNLAVRKAVAKKEDWNVNSQEKLSIAESLARANLVWDELAKMLKYMYSDTQGIASGRSIHDVIQRFAPGLRSSIADITEQQFDVLRIEKDPKLKKLVIDIIAGSIQDYTATALRRAHAISKYNDDVVNFPYSGRTYLIRGVVQACVACGLVYQFIDPKLGPDVNVAVRPILYSGAALVSGSEPFWGDRQALSLWRRMQGRIVDLATRKKYNEAVYQVVEGVPLNIDPIEETNILYRLSAESRSRINERFGHVLRTLNSILLDEPIGELGEIEVQELHRELVNDHLISMQNVTNPYTWSLFVSVLEPAISVLKGDVKLSGTKWQASQAIADLRVILRQTLEIIGTYKRQIAEDRVTLANVLRLLGKTRFIVQGRKMNLLFKFESHFETLESSILKLNRLQSALQAAQGKLEQEDLAKPESHILVLQETLKLILGTK